MADVTGAGLAFVFDDFSMRLAPTSYAELTGAEPTANAAAYGWKRGDARYYGISMTSATTSLTNGSGNAYYGTDWFSSLAGGGGCGNTASAGAYSNLSCPMGVGDGDFGVNAFASIYDPYVLRVFEYEGYNYDGAWLNQAAGSGPSTGAGATAMPTVLEFRGPAQSDTWRWSFWGELEIDRANNNADLGACNSSGSSDAGACTSVNGTANFLQSQTIILGKPVAAGQIWNRSTNTYSARPQGPRRAVQRWMYTTDTSDPTFGVTYDSALSGDFRFSVRQKTGSPDSLHFVPDFNDTEGLYFRNVDAFIPLGALHYQNLTFSGVSEYDQDGNKLANPVQNGNFSIELTQIPNVASVYNNFYCGANPNVGLGCTLDARGAIANPNPDTHGYVRWGDWSAANTSTGAGLPGSTSTTNGIYFIGADPSGTPLNNVVSNIGISRIEGMLIHHMKITSLGAGVAP